MTRKLEIWPTGGAAYVDYSGWLHGASPLLRRTHRVNEPQELAFFLQDGVTGFGIPESGNRVRVQLDTFPDFFTGYLAGNPKRELLGSKDGLPVYAYRCRAFDETLRLEWPVSSIFPTLPPFINKTQGAILAELIALLGGGLTTTEIDAGILIPFFRVKPDEGFWDAVRRLSDRTNMAFWVTGGDAYYKAFDDAAFPYSASEQDAAFDPQSLDIEPVDHPVFNDVVGLGGPEPQAYVREYFIGDGFTGIFPLRFPLFGAESSKLLEDDFVAAAINADLWTETDPDSLISASSGSLVFSGGPSSNNHRLTANQGLEIAGVLELRAGRVRFTAPTNAILGGVFDADTGLAVDCVAGFSLVPGYPSETEIQPLVNGSLEGPTYITQAGKTYQFILTLNCPEALRRRREFFSLQNQYGGADVAANATVTFAVLELTDDESDDPVRVLEHATSISSIPAFLFYTLISGPGNGTDDVGLVLNFTLLRKAIHAELWTLKPDDLDVIEETGPKNPASASNQGQIPSGDWQNPTNVFTSNDSRATRSLSAGGFSNGLIIRNFDFSSIPDDHVVDGIKLRLERSSDTSSSIEDEEIKLIVGFDSLSGLYLARGENKAAVGSWPTSDAYAEYGGETDKWNLPIIPVSLLKSANFGVVVGVENAGVGTAEARIDHAELLVYHHGYAQRRLGDKADPEAWAGIVTGSEGHQLGFFQNRIPVASERIRLVYREAGVARARVSLASSITAEAEKSGDSGVRAAILPSISPVPRDAAELERAIQAFINDHTSQFYRGSWDFDSHAYVLSGDAFPGRFISVDVPTRHPSNLLIRSEQLDNAAWLLSAGGFAPTVTPNVASPLAPDGTQTAEQLVFPSTGVLDAGWIYQLASGLADIVGNPFTNSFYLRASASVSIRLRIINQSQSVLFETTANLNSSTWQRFTVTGTIGAGPTNIGIAIVQVANSPSKTIFAWGGQMNRGGVAHPYIRTVATPIADGSPISAFVNTVTTDVLGSTPTDEESIQVTAEFGTLSRFEESRPLDPPEETLQGPLDRVTEIEALAFADVGSAYAADRPDAAFTGDLTSTTAEIDSGAAPSSSYEVRKTDQGWGSAQTVNRISNPSTQAFTVPRNSRDILAFLKNKTAGGLLSRYPSAIRIAYPLVPPAVASATIDASKRRTVAVTLNLLADPTDIYGIEIRDEDDSTILYSYKDILLGVAGLTHAGLTFNWENALGENSKTLFAYAFNLLGEYSAQLQIDITVEPLILRPSLFTETTALGGAIADPRFAFDADEASYSQVDVPSTSSANAVLEIFGFPGLQQEPVRITLKYRSEVTTNGSTSGIARGVYKLQSDNVPTNIFEVTNATRSLQTDSIELGTGFNPADLLVYLQTQNGIPATGTVVARLHEVWLEVI